MKYFIKTFGCRVSFTESDELKQELSKKLTYTTSEKDSDIIIIRACSVTAKAEQKVRQEIRKHKRAQKNIYVLGCFRQKIPEANKYFESDKSFLRFIDNVDYDKRRSLCKQLPAKDISGLSPEYRLPKKENRTRAFIKIQDGCDFECSFCITRLLRGKSRCKSQSQIIKQIKIKEAQGFKEIVLTGINILLYPDIHNLIKNILKQSTIPRIRFGSIDPRLINDRFIKLFKNPRLMPHMHLSLQSGSEIILKRMTRPIKIQKIRTIAKQLRAINPLFNLSADIIVGFLDETEKDFEKTLKLAKKLKLSKIHYFPYSPRPGTSAENKKKLPAKLITARLQKIKKLDNVLQQEAIDNLKNKKIQILFESFQKGFYIGYSPNFIRIKYPSKKNLTNYLKEIIISL